MRKLTSIFIFIVLGFLGLVNSAEGFFHKKSERAPAEESYFKKLGIEKSEKKTSAPDFVLEDLFGRRSSLKDFRGKVVFLNFWATWCIPCRQEMPAMEKLHRELKKEGLEVVAVNFKEGREEIQKFFTELGLTFTALLDKDGKVFEKYGAWGLPVTYIIDQKGALVGKAAGYKDWHSRDAKAFFRWLLNEKSKGRTE
jgi:thiol-disulfide isomerase/thioredoxin